MTFSRAAEDRRMVHRHDLLRDYLAIVGKMENVCILRPSKSMSVNKPKELLLVYPRIENDHYPNLCKVKDWKYLSVHPSGDG